MMRDETQFYLADARMILATSSAAAAAAVRRLPTASDSEVIPRKANSSFSVWFESRVSRLLPRASSLDVITPRDSPRSDCKLRTSSPIDLCASTATPSEQTIESSRYVAGSSSCADRSAKRLSVVSAAVERCFMSTVASLMAVVALAKRLTASAKLPVRAVGVI